MKEFLGILTVALTTLGFTLYIGSIFRSKAKPHLASWLIWTPTSGLVFAIQLTNGAGAGSWANGVSFFFCATILILSWRIGTKTISRLDMASMMLASLAIFAWLGASNPLAAIIFAIATDLFAFLPTYKKSFHSPFQEPLGLYSTNILRFTIVLIAIENYAAVNWLQPATSGLFNFALACLIVSRRRASSTSSRLQAHPVFN